MCWYEDSVSLQILAACVWVGGMIFLAIVVLPILRQPGYRSVAMPLSQAAGVQFRWVGWMVLGMLVLTGVANLTSEDMAGPRCATGARGRGGSATRWR